MKQQVKAELSMTMAVELTSASSCHVDGNGPVHVNVVPKDAIAADSPAYRVPRSSSSRLLQPRFLVVLLVCLVVSAVASLVAQALLFLINLVTNISFFGTLSIKFMDPAKSNIGVGLFFLPCLGGLITGLIARYGKVPAIRGHGIPEAMVRILFFKSEISARVLVAKPLSAAFVIGTGGPFGAEGPIIATGSALGSLLAQYLHVTAHERKIILVSGAASGMSYIFNAPLASVLISIELLLFEFKPHSLIPVALSAYSAALIRTALYPVGGAGHQTGVFFDVGSIDTPRNDALVFYLFLGAVIGLCAVFASKTVFFVESLFRKLEGKIHWMWFPVIGAIVVGAVGYAYPRTLGVGYENITDFAKGGMSADRTLLIAGMKFISWSVSLGSGTSGGTLAPLFTIGSGVAVWVASVFQTWFPGADIHSNLAAAVGMAAMFTGAARAPLTSIAFVLETTNQMSAGLALCGACFVSYLISIYFMQFSIMTEAIYRNTNGKGVPSGYTYDYADVLEVQDIMTEKVEVVRLNDTLLSLKARFATDSKLGTLSPHKKCYPLVDDEQRLFGVLRLVDILNWAHEAEKPTLPDQGKAGSSIAVTVPQTELRLCDFLSRIQPPVVAYAQSTLREASQQLVQHGVTILPILESVASRKCVGVLSSKDLLLAIREEQEDQEVKQRVRKFKSRRSSWDSKRWNATEGGDRHTVASDS